MNLFLCTYFQCRLAESACVQRQQLKRRVGLGRRGGSELRQDDRMRYCQSGACAQGQEILVRLTSGLAANRNPIKKHISGDFRLSKSPPTRGIEPETEDV